VILFDEMASMAKENNEIMAISINHQRQQYGSNK
jgi:hypothetical protein